MGKPISKKPGKGTNVPGSSFPMFRRAVTNWQGVVGNAQSPLIYPGAVIPVDDIEDFFTTGSKWFLSKEKADEYYAQFWKNAVPLDDELADALFQILSWFSEMKELTDPVSDFQFGPYEHNTPEVWVNHVDTIYMEAVYRWIQNKKK